MLSKCQMMERFMILYILLLTSGSFGVCFDLIIFFSVQWLNSLVMNTYFLEFHNWNLHLPIYHLQICLFLCLFKREGGVDLSWLAGSEC